ncbi:MAG: transposase [Acidobacteriota bacterium]|nr:transposase [Acidobacteriota bacterium]
MSRPIGLKTRRELTAAIVKRYEAAGRPGKKAILDEFVKVTGYHRKHAIRILSGKQTTQQKRAVGKRVYYAAVDEALIVLWEAADRICGKRLKALLPTLVEAMERHKHLSLDDTVRALLLRMSAATIDRRLQKVRVQAFGTRRQKRALNRVRKLVAVKTFADWKDVRPGFMEIDLVTHSGPRAAGSFVHTLVLTDVASGWTECVALPMREQALIVEAITAVQARLPFPLFGLDTDNDSAFMNDTLWDYCQQHKLELTRSRAYRKNDQAWVEQKNGAVVRKLVGYGRLEGLAATAALRRLYEAARLYVNFFQPSFKLKDKEREGAKVRKHYEAPQTPYQRLLQSDHVAEGTKKRLQEQFQQLDPVLLLKHVRDAQAVVVALGQNIAPPPVSEDMQKFVSSLATAWRSGEVRPTHRREPQPGRRWRTRKDPFAEVWPVLLGWLEERPEMEAKQMLQQLQASGYGSYTDGQLRTLQRRVREWRTRMARALVYGADAAQVATEALAG